MHGSIDLHAKIKTKLYAKENEVENEIQETKQLEAKGKLVSAKVSSDKEIYKGYLYTNTENETIYKENVSLEISEASNINEIQLETNSNNFVDVNGILNNANNNVYYKEIKMKKKNIQEILGENATIVIESEQGGEIATINSESAVNEQGEIITTLETNEINNIIINTSKPEKEGTIAIEFTKGIKSNGYSKEQLKQFLKLEEQLKITTNKKQITEQETNEIQEETVNAQIEMKDTVSEAKISVNAEKLSTLNENENLIFNATLISNDQTHDLYKNPCLDIYLPSEIENVEINSVKVLYVNEENIAIENYLVREEEGKKVISVVLTGEQTKFVNKTNKGIQILIDTNVSVSKKTSTKVVNIEMVYKNENGNEEKYYTNTKITLESKYGMFVYNSIENINQEKLDNIDGSDIEARLDVNQEEKTAKINTLLVNNYLEPVNNVAIIGNLNTEDSNIDVTLLDKIQLNNAKVYYATENTTEKESENWQEEVENIEKVKAYKIEMENLNQEENTELSYDLKIPADLDYNQKSISDIQVLYNYEEKEQNNDTKINLSTIEAKTDNQEQITNIENTRQQEVEGIGNIYVESTYADSILEDGQTVFQGQSVKNTIVVENTTGNEITNLNLIATQTNANFFMIERSEEMSSVGGILVTERTVENTEALENNLGTIESLKPGERVTYEYQYVIKEDAKDSTIGKLKITANNIEEKEIQISENTIDEGDLKLVLICGYNETMDLYTGGIIKLALLTKNISRLDKQDVIVEMHIPDITEFDEESYYLNNVEIIENENGIVKFKIPELKAGEEVDIPLYLSITELDPEKEEDYCRVYYQATENDKTYTSNEVYKKVNNVLAKLEIEQTGSSTKKTIKTGEELIYRTKIRNVSVIDKEFEILDSVPKAAVIQDAYIESEGEEIKIEEIESNTIRVRRLLKAKTEITLVIRTKIDTSIATNYTLKNTVYLNGTGQSEQSNTIEYVLNLSPTQNETEQSIENEISGTVWIDKNRDGKKETSEEKMSGMEVWLINTNAEEVTTSENGISIKTTTDENGNYKLTGMPNGKYMVVFAYDTVKYTPTEYKKESLSYSQNSDIVQGELNGKVVALTDALVFNNTAYSFVDAGFKENYIFDLKLDKYISKVIVQNHVGTSVQEYNKMQLTKIEIPTQYLQNTTVLVEYQIEVTNEGEIEGYANEIVDYMPKDMIFSSELNKDWYIGQDGNLHTVALTDIIIKPGETKFVNLILTKTMTQNNTGKSTNIAEIINTSNSLSINDIDSQVGNYKDGEDDISKAEILISISTGAAQISLYILITLIILIGIVYEIYRIKSKQEG